MAKTKVSEDTWRLILVPHTHWDREWYLPYQQYRTRLTGFFDLLLDILDSDADYRHFMLDGHTILVEDYLEIRPDRRAMIERYVREGRLTLGPQYVIPDESLPSGEALVRNLLRGYMAARDLGGVMNVGYWPDPFGQIAHLPALLRGFGIERCVFWRGTDDSLTTSEFVWQAPDDSEVLVKHMRGGYGIGAPFPVDVDAFIERIQSIRKLLQPLAQTRTLLIMWGSDHVPPQRELAGLVAAANVALTDADVIQGSLPEVFDDIEAQIDRSQLPRRRGEFRSGQHSNILPGVLSARMWIKQRTFDSEQLLTRWAEPLSVWSGLLRSKLGEVWKEPPPTGGPPSPHPSEAASEAGLLSAAWRLLLENQPHDSICGCSIDQTHDEMRPRFDQCEQIGEDVTHEAMRRIGAQGQSERVYVFNPLPGPRSDYVTAVVSARRAAAPIAVVDDLGRRCAASPASGPDAPVGLPSDRQAIGFVASDVPGFGYRTYVVEYGQATEEQPRSDSRIENEFFALEADPGDGTLTVYDKRDGQGYVGLNRFVDGGDRGDEYNYCPPDPDLLVEEPATAPDIRVVECGSGRSTLEVNLTYRLPAAMTAERQRSGRFVSCPIRVLASLSPGVPRIDIRTEIDNRTEDHRLRAHFPAALMADVSCAEQHFGVVRRPIALPEADETWQEQPVAYHPQKMFVDVNDGQRGLLIANRGLPEYEVIDGPDGLTIALTLLRCVGWLSRDDLSVRKGGAGPPLPTPGAQCRGRNVFDYAIIPHEGSWQQAYAEAHRFAAPLRARWNPNGTGQLPDHASLLELEGDGLVVSALKRAEDGVGTVVRLYNILDEPTMGRMRLTEPWSQAQVVDMKEDPLGPAEVGDGWVRLGLRSNEIVTVRFYTA